MVEGLYFSTFLLKIWYYGIHNRRMIKMKKNSLLLLILSTLFDFKSSDVESKRVLYPPNECNDYKITLKLPIGFWILGGLIVAGIFFVGFVFIGYRAPQEHIPQIVNVCGACLV